MDEITWGHSGKKADRQYIITYCGNKGWEHIISSLIDDLFKLGWDGVLYQVKEKFGGLRFYIGQGTDEIHNRINQASMQSEQTCVECGSPGKLRYGGWIIPLCDEHAKERGRT